MDYSVLSESPLFSGCTLQQAEEMVQCLGGECRIYDKGQTIFHAGDHVASLGIVLSGQVLIQAGDLWGNVTVLDMAGPGQSFAKTYACVPQEPLMVDVIAFQPARILFLSIDRILTTCPQTCTYHSRLIRNLLTLSAQKNLALSRKIFHTSSKTIRGRLLSYLSYQAVRSGSSCFTIPFNRQQLADYLNVERSALSNELGKMQREGLIKTQRSQFQLLHHRPRD